MENRTFAALVGLGLLFVVGFVLFFFGVNNTCVTYEVGIKAQFEQNKNSYDGYFKKLTEAAQVPEMYRDDLKKVFDSAMTGRYGENGSKAILQAIQEQNPNLDSSLYRQLQQIIEAGRNGFASDQKDLIAKKQEYEKYMSSMPSGLFAKLFGFPKIDLEKYKIVTSDRTEEDFNSGKSDPFKIRQTPEKNK